MPIVDVDIRNVRRKAQNRFVLVLYFGYVNNLRVLMMQYIFVVTYMLTFHLLNF